MFSLSKARFYVIPKQIHAHLLKNKFNTIDAISYDNMRSVLSLDDLAQLCFLNTSIDSNPISYLHDGDYEYCINSLEKIFSSSNTEGLRDNHRAEYFSTVVPLSQTAQVAEAAISKLSHSDDDMMNVLYSSSDTALYTFAMLNNAIITVVVREDFFSAIQNRGVLLDFLRECLRYIYGLVPISEVSRTSLFSKYMKELKSAST
jgi:hypothetical protein